jgi:hypothetical protein
MCCDTTKSIIFSVLLCKDGSMVMNEKPKKRVLVIAFVALSPSIYCYEALKCFS